MMLEKLTMETAIAHRIYEVADKPGEEVQIFIGKPVQYSEMLKKVTQDSRTKTVKFLHRKSAIHA